jgi:hypothetical protein
MYICVHAYTYHCAQVTITAHYNQKTCMYVCMYVCNTLQSENTHVCMYICMYVIHYNEKTCMYVYMYVCMHHWYKLTLKNVTPITAYNDVNKMRNNAALATGLEAVASDIMICFKLSNLVGFSTFVSVYRMCMYVVRQ